MTTSGTVGQTTTDVTTIIEHAARRCGVVASTLTSEQQLSARENLGFILNTLSNLGVNLWCVQKYLISLVSGQAIYNLPAGSVDLLDSLYRQLQFPTVSNSSATLSLTGQLTTSAQITSVQVTASSSGLANLVVESSPDGNTWTTVLTISQFTAVSGVGYWFDLDGAPTVQYWRVRETVAASIGFSSPLWGNTTAEIPMSKLSRDDYTSLPNKTFEGQRPLQFWFDKQATQPRIWLWPVPNDATISLALYIHRHPQDVGAYTNTLDLPNRWLEPIIFTLAHRMSLELPGVQPDRITYLESQSEKYLAKAGDGETDGSPIRLAPNISCYTR